MAQHHDEETAAPLLPLHAEVANFQTDTVNNSHGWERGDDNRDAEGGEENPFSDTASHTSSADHTAASLQRTATRRRTTPLPAPTRQHEFEAAHANHHYTPAERQRLNLTESIDYFPPNSKVYRRWLQSQPHRRTWDRWFMMGSIGVSIGLVGYLLYTVIGILTSIKVNVVNWLLAHTGVFIAWVFNVTYSVLLVAAASWTVVEFAPAAAGAGVAEVMAYLNGCRIPKIFNAKTLLVKFVSCACAVGSGLPVGPEGPMISIGAMIGSALSQGHSTTMNFSTGLFTRFQNPKDQRDFVTAGAGIGVAVAFNAPIGGLLFAFEEVASFFSTTLGWQMFFGCMLSILMLNTCRSAQEAFSGGSFGLLDGDASTVFFEQQTVLSNHVAAVVPAAIIGLVCGGASILFTMLNLKVARLRASIIGLDRKWRMLEPVVFTAIFVTVSMMLPLFLRCMVPDCVNEQGITEPVCRNGTQADGITSEAHLEHWTCPVLKASDGKPDPIQPYNPLAILMDVPGDEAIRHLLTRGTHREFSPSTLLIMLCVYFVGAAMIAGSAISSGLFVPMLVIGCLLGRLVGVWTLDIAATYGGPEFEGIFLPPSPWAWIDPGVFALFGAGAFMGGTTRLTIALAVIMMEMSNDVRMLLPLLVAIMVAKAVGDAATHSLYHGQLHVKAIPYLPEEPIAKMSLDLLSVSHVMASPVVTFQAKMQLKDLRWALRNTTHNGFPVVRRTQHGEVFVGLVVRDHLMVLLRQALGRGAGAHETLSYSDLNRRYVSSAAQRIITEQQMAVLQATADPETDGAVESTELDLQPYINTSALTVDQGFSAERTYILLRTLGLRHITVVDRHNRVKGIVTRKDLLGYRLEEAVDRMEMDQGYISPQESH